MCIPCSRTIGRWLLPWHVKVNVIESMAFKILLECLLGLFHFATLIAKLYNVKHFFHRSSFICRYYSLQKSIWRFLLVNCFVSLNLNRTIGRCHLQKNNWMHQFMGEPFFLDNLLTCLLKWQDFITNLSYFTNPLDHCKVLIGHLSVMGDLYKGVKESPLSLHLSNNDQKYKSLLYLYSYWVLSIIVNIL